MLAKNKTTQKFITCLIIIAMLAPAGFLMSKPKKAEAIFGLGDIVFDPAHTAVTFKIVAQEILRQFLMLAARRLLGQITQSTVNWINAGFHGNPLYIENSKSFFKDIAKHEIRNLVDIYGYDSSRFPYGRDFALNTINAYRRQASDNAAYTLSNVINDPILLRNYRTNFNVGGWNGFLINTQYPQNNYIGFQMLANEELARRLDGTSQNAAQKINTALAQGQGFLSPQTCPSNPRYNNLKNEFQRPRFDASKEVPYNPPPIRYMGGARGEGSDVLDPEWEKEKALYDYQHDIDVNVARAQWDEKNSCPGGLVSTTPGVVVASQITNAMGSKLRNTELAAAMGNSIAAVLDTLLNHFLNKGLNALSNRVNPPPDNSNLDDFEYLGDTINSTRDIQLPEKPPEEAPPPENANP